MSVSITDVRRQDLVFFLFRFNYSMHFVVLEVFFLTCVTGTFGGHSL